LSLIYDSVADVLYYIRVEPDDCFRFVSINQAFLKATGLTSDQIVGKRIEEVIPKTSVQMVLNNSRRAIEENRIVRWEEVFLGMSTPLRTNCLGGRRTAIVFSSRVTEHRS